MARRTTTISSGGPKVAAGRTSRPRPTSTRVTCISSSTPVFLHQHRRGRAGGSGTAPGCASSQFLRNHRRRLVCATRGYWLRGQGRQISCAATGLQRCRTGRLHPGAFEKLNKEINAIVLDPAMKARLNSLGVEPLSMTPAEFGKRILDDTEKWAKVIKFANITAE
jgi:hypothetical protein